MALYGVMLVMVALLVGWVSRGESSLCNEAVCASVVSKCMLTQSCKCELTHCSCCKDCANCLSYLYSECCACVDMCQESVDPSNNLSRNSYKEKFADQDIVPQLYAALTSPESSENGKLWNVFALPPIPAMDTSFQTLEQDLLKPNYLCVNCTVTYYVQCMSWYKCKNSCTSMGAAGFRWFSDGCCECFGDTCTDYGLDESRCLGCKDGVGVLEEDPLDDDLDYGEDMDPQNAESYNK